MTIAIKSPKNTSYATDGTNNYAVSSVAVPVTATAVRIASKFSTSNYTRVGSQNNAVTEVTRLWAV